MTALTLNLDPIICLTDEQFYQLCQANRDIKFEQQCAQSFSHSLRLIPASLRMAASNALLMSPLCGLGNGESGCPFEHELMALSRKWPLKT